jgi:hypothetical protein
LWLAVVAAGLVPARAETPAELDPDLKLERSRREGEKEHGNEDREVDKKAEETDPRPREVNTLLYDWGCHQAYRRGAVGHIEDKPGPCNNETPCRGLG